MCFSAEASFGVAIALLPAGAYCMEAAWRKDRHYFLLAMVPIFFGIQQLCEALVWLGIERAHPETVRVAALTYLGIALAVWPVWIPLATAALEPRVRRKRLLLALAGFGLLFGLVVYLPLAANGGRGVDPTIIGHSIRYDLSVAPVISSFWWWGWLAVYLLAVSVPLIASRNHRLQPLGLAVVLCAIVSYLLFEYAFASVWCFFAAILSMYLTLVLHQAPGQNTENDEPQLQPIPSN